MARKKYQPNQVKYIRILLILYKGSEDSPTKQGEFTLNSDVIDYNTIKQICQQFLREHQVQYQTNIYLVDTTTPYYQRILIQPGFIITAKQILSDFQGNLVFMMTSTIEELKKNFQDQINNLKQEIDQLKLQVDFLKKPLTLELLRKNSIAPSPLMLQSHSYHSKNYSRIDNYDQIQLDIAILFSEPLYDEQRKKNTSPAVDFRSEITRVHGALQNSFKPSIIMRCQIATFQTLQTTIKYSKPKIMHIICHGNSEGNLEFEDDSRNTLGLLQLLKPIDLKNLLKFQKDFLPELVFINSCHSEKVGRAFYQLGVPNVVMINSEDLISDEAAQIFSQNFYRKIFKGTSINQAFITSKARVQQKFVGQCCCNHSPALQPHRQQCQWFRMSKNQPIQSHRNYHVPKCDCEQKNKNMHSFKCEWAKKTLFQINKDFRIQEIKDDGSKHYVFPAHISKFPPYVKENWSNYLTICCCPPKQGKPHSESNKFLILSNSNGEKVLMPVMHNREHPQITDLTSTQLLEAHQKSKAIFGRQRQLFEFLKNMQDTNFMYIYGKTGVGLTTFTIKASTYMMQRRVFQFFFFFDLYDIKDVTVFRYKFNEITKFQYNGTSVVDFGIKSKKILLLFDNCDSFINEDSQKFYQEMQNLLREFPKCKIIITFKQQTRAIFIDKKINEMNLGYELLPFQQKIASFFLHGKMRNKVQISVGMKQLKSLIKKYEVLRIPKVIQSLSQSIPITKKNVTLEQIEKKVQQIKISDTNSLTKSVLNQLNQINHEAYQFLVFCSLFSDGVTFEDINMFSSYFKPGMSILPIRKNWQQHYLLLLEKQPTTANVLNQPVPKLQTSMSYSEQANVHPEQRPKIQMKKKQSEEVLAPLNPKQKGEFDRLNKLGAQSYFIDRNGPGKFIVKRFIRDYLWKSHLNQTTNQTKFLFVAYFSVILEMLFETLKAQNYIHEQLTAYSAISGAGIFKFKTKMRDVYAQKSLTQSVRYGISFMNDLKEIFMNNEQLQQKMKKTDHSTFIMNHRQDFLKFYDTEWLDVYTHLSKKGKGQQKMFVILLQNLMVYIPTAFKIAGAEQSLLQYVLKRSEKQLNKFRQFSQKDRNLKILLKLYMIRLGISLESSATEIKSIFTNGYKHIQDCKMQLQKLKLKSLEIEDIKQVLKMQQFCCSLILDDKRLKMNQTSDFNHINTQKYEFLSVNQEVAALQPLIRAKQGLLISCLFLKFIQNNKPQFTIALKSLNQNNQFKNTQIFGILMICQNSIQIFKKKNCVKLQLKAKLVAIELFWVFNEKIRLNKKQYTTEEIDFWSKKLVQCQRQFLSESNRLRGFTQFDDKIKQLKQKTKQKYWVSASKRLIFMKAYPLSSKQEPILKNLIRKKNNFRQQIQKILAKRSRQDGDRPDRRNQQSPSIRQISNVNNDDKKSLDISTKYEILTGNKVSEQARAKCSIMFINVDIKTSSGKVYLICQNEIMQQELVELNQQLAANLNMDNMLIVVLTGINTRKAMQKILQFNKNPPVIICLESEPIESQVDIEFIHEIDSKFIRQLIKRQNQIKQAELVYTKTFIQIVIGSQITKKQEIFSIHEKAQTKMIEKVTNCHVKAYIELDKCRQKFNLKFNPGIYRDLSPGFEGNHNIDSRSYDSAVSIRRWRKMIQFFKFLNLKKNKTHTNENEEKRRNLFSSGNSKQQIQFKVDLPGTHINIYGQNGSGKTYFIREIAKILVEREFYDFGVFLFEGKRIQKQFNGDFEAYIKKQASLGKMPVLDDFQRLLSDKTILIVDDFHIIKSRINARMKIFLDKVISKKVNLVLVSIIELKLDYLPVIKKIRLESLDPLETEVLAYNIINISSEEQLVQFRRLKERAAKENRNPTVKEIEAIDKNFKGAKRKGQNQRTSQKYNHQQETSAQEGEVRRMKKSFTSYQKQ